MSERIDCLFIGHNDISFMEYEKMVRSLGHDSHEYRNIDHYFVWQNKKPYTSMDLFNLYCGDEYKYASYDYSVKKMTFGENFSLAIAYLGTYLHRRGFTFDYVNAFQEEKEELKQKLLENDYQVIAIITTFYGTPLPIHEVMNFIKTHSPGTPILIGGPFIAHQVAAQEPQAIESMLQSIGADFYINSSQGEAALVGLLNALKHNLSLDRVNNLYIKTDKGYVSTSMVRENNDLVENMVQWDLFAERNIQCAAIRTSISCPFSCSFCTFPKYAGPYHAMPVEAVEKDLKALAKLGTVKSVSFIDDTLNINKERFKSILELMIKNDFGFEWHSFLRCQYADRETVKLMKESGCGGVFLGIESGNNQILKNMNKRVTVEEYRRGIEILKENDIAIVGSFIFGFPGETDETAHESMKFVEENEIDFYTSNVWFNHPQTSIYQEKEKYKVSGDFFNWKHATMDADTAFELKKEMHLTIKNSIDLSDYNFFYENVFRLLHQGVPLDRIKNFTGIFSRMISDKIKQPFQTDVRPELIREMENAFVYEEPGESKEPVLLLASDMQPEEEDFEF